MSESWEDIDAKEAAVPAEEAAAETPAPAQDAAAEGEAAPAAAEAEAAAAVDEAATSAASAAEAAPSSTAPVATSGHDSDEDDEEDDEEEDDEEGDRRRGDGEEVEDTREHLNVVFIGHVDAGKSTLSGNLLFRTGEVDERTVAKYEREAKEKNRESWFYAYIMDTNEEERAKGKTVEVGRAYFHTPKKRYTILDAPGHKNYVPNMIGGAAQADVGILVISARRGEFETGFERGGQTCEHATLAKTLGVRQIIVAVNKMDESTVMWDKERYDEIVKKMTKFLKSVGYNPKTDIHFLPVSGMSGSYLTDTTTAPCDWYKGPSLVEMLDDLKPQDRDETGPLRMPVLDRYKSRGTVYAMGKLESGTIEKGMKVSLHPGNHTAEISSVEIDNKSAKYAKPGENLTIGLSGVTLDMVQQGSVMCELGATIPCVSEFECQLAIIDLLPHKPIVTCGYEAMLHVHTISEPVSVKRLVSMMNKKTKKPTKRPPTVVKRGDVATVVLETSRPVCLEEFTTLQQLGRFTLRDEGKTVAIGKVMKVPAEGSTF